MSGLADVVKVGVETAFTAAADFVELGTYYARGSAPVYDSATDTLVYTPLTFTNVRMIRTSAKREEREASQVTVGDFKFLIPAVDLNNREPDETDRIEYAGVMYNVLAAEIVPGGSLFMIMARKA